MNIKKSLFIIIAFLMMIVSPSAAFADEVYSDQSNTSNGSQTSVPLDKNGVALEGKALKVYS